MNFGNFFVLISALLVCIFEITVIDLLPEHQDMINALKEIGIENNYIKIVQDVYTDAIARVHLDKDVSDLIEIQRRVRQGDPASPKFFTTALEKAFRKANLEGKGIRIDGEELTNTRFADDDASFVLEEQQPPYELTKTREPPTLIQSNWRTDYASQGSGARAHQVRDGQAGRPGRRRDPDPSARLPRLDRR